MSNCSIPVMNKRILDAIESETNIKQAQAAASEATRMQLREDGFIDFILPPEKADDSMLTVSVENDIPVITWEKEIDSPGAMWVPLQTVPEGEYIQGSRYQIPLSRLMTRKAQKDIDELRTFKSDIRRQFSENAIKDAIAERDGKFISTVNKIVADAAPAVGSKGARIQNLTGKVQWLTTAGAFTKENLVDALKMLPSGSTIAGRGNKLRLKNHLMLMNETTAMEFLKFDRSTIGDLSAEQFKTGRVHDLPLGVKLITTIKGAIVPDGVVYFFAAPEFLGKHFYLTDWTTFLKKEGPFVESWSYWYGGFAFGNVAGVARADFDVNAFDLP